MFNYFTFPAHRGTVAGPASRIHERLRLICRRDRGAGASTAARTNYTLSMRAGPVRPSLREPGATIRFHAHRSTSPPAAARTVYAGRDRARLQGPAIHSGSDHEANKGRDIET